MPKGDCDYGQGSEKSTVDSERCRGRTVRLDLTDAEHKRLERVAERKGLNKASYCRMVVLERLEADEESTPR